ncbi:MAG: hypothetical protein KME22_23140 [Hassallia sp. WJT32-NPBG1]|nr:hypothetical protein [Hassallia sp. WJT32-NPBG1]
MNPHVVVQVQSVIFTAELPAIAQMAQVGSRKGRISILGLWEPKSQFRVCFGSRWL